MRKTGAVIAAAGLSSRMGAFKPLQRIGGASVIETILFTLRRAAIDPIVIVLGHNGAALEKHLAQSGAAFVYNPRFAASEMLDSVKIGLAWMQHQCARVLLTPADVPLFTAQTVRLLASVLDEGVVDVAIPTHDGLDGHPLCLQNTAIPAVLRYTGSDGLRGALRENFLRIRRVPVEDEGVRHDMDTPTDYENILRLYESMSDLL
jgi:CTP:molybdopterin cytidylyltransferase MocA